MKETWWPLICLAGAAIGYVFFMGLSPLRASMGNAYRLQRTHPFPWLLLACCLLLGSLFNILPNLNSYLKSGFSFWGEFSPTSFVPHREESLRQSIIATGGTFTALQSLGILSLFSAIWICMNLQNSFRIFGEECEQVFGKAGWPAAFAVFLSALSVLSIPLFHWLDRPVPVWVSLLSTYFGIFAALGFQFFIILYTYIWLRNPDEFAPLRVPEYLYALLPKALPVSLLLFVTHLIWRYFLPSTWIWGASLLTSFTAVCFAYLAVALVISKRQFPDTIALNFAMILKDLPGLVWILLTALLHWFLLIGLSASMESAFFAFSLPNLVWQVASRLLYAFIHVWLVSILVIRLCEHLKFPKKRRRF